MDHDDLPIRDDGGKDGVSGELVSLEFNPANNFNTAWRSLCKRPIRAFKKKVLIDLSQRHKFNINLCTTLCGCMGANWFRDRNSLVRDKIHNWNAQGGSDISPDRAIWEKMMLIASTVGVPTKHFPSYLTQFAIGSKCFMRTKHERKPSRNARQLTNFPFRCRRPLDVTGCPSDCWAGLAAMCAPLSPSARCLCWDANLSRKTFASAINVTGRVEMNAKKGNVMRAWSHGEQEVRNANWYTPSSAVRSISCLRSGASEAKKLQIEVIIIR